GTPDSSVEGTAITLGSTASDPGTNDTFTYAWTVTKNGDVYSSGSDSTISFTPGDNGTYLATLVVTDNDGDSATDSQTINVSNIAPTASISGAPGSSPEGTTILLTGSGGDAGSVDVLSYSWTVTKNGSNYASGSGSDFQFTPDDNGSYVVTLT